MQRRSNLGNRSPPIYVTESYFLSREPASRGSRCYIPNDILLFTHLLYNLRNNKRSSSIEQFLLSVWKSLLKLGKQDIKFYS